MTEEKTEEDDGHPTSSHTRRRAEDETFAEIISALPITSMKVHMRIISIARQVNDTPTSRSSCRNTECTHELTPGIVLSAHDFVITAFGLYVV